MELATTAEYLARKLRTPALQLLVLDISGAMSKGSFRLNASLLVMTGLQDAAWRPQEPVVPTYLDVLATNMKTIVISSGIPLRSLTFQNFQHRVLLHVSLQRRFGERTPVSVPTLFWFGDGARKYRCPYFFDRLIVLKVEITSEVCSGTSIKCVYGSSFFKRKQMFLVPKVDFLLFIRCNASIVEIDFLVTHIVESQFEKSVLYRYSVSKDELLSCFSYIRWHETGVGALVEPFPLEVWILTVVSTLILAKFSSWAEMKNCSDSVVKIWLLLISEMDITPGRRASELLAACSNLLFCFFIGLIYNNYIMFYFLNPQRFDNCTAVQNCQHVPLCYADYNLLHFLRRSGCVCNINEQQRSLIGKPLRRLMLRSVPFPSKYDQNLMYFQAYGPKKGRLLLVAARPSPTIDHLFTTGIIPGKSFKYSRAEMTSLLTAEDHRALRLFNKMDARKLPDECRKLVDFDTKIDWFDMNNFIKLRWVFAVCALIFSTAFGFENFRGRSVMRRLGRIASRWSLGE